MLYTLFLFEHVHIYKQDKCGKGDVLFQPIFNLSDNPLWWIPDNAARRLPASPPSSAMSAPVISVIFKYVSSKLMRIFEYFL